MDEYIFFDRVGDIAIALSEGGKQTWYTFETMLEPGPVELSYMVAKLREPFDLVKEFS